MAIKLHRCPNLWVKIGAHPCWKVQKTLDDQGVEYELVKGPLRRGKRDDLEKLSGQRLYPVIEFEDGSAAPSQATLSDPARRPARDRLRCPAPWRGRARA